MVGRRRRARWLLVMLMLGALLLGGAGTAGAQTGPPTPGERVLVAARPPRASDLVVGGYDLWEVDAERAVLLTDQRDWDRLVAEGYDLTVLRRFPVTRRAAGAVFGPGYYRGYDAIVAEMQAVQKAHPDIVTLSNRGPSWETFANPAVNRFLWAAKITSTKVTAAKPAVLYLSAYHAREVVTPELALRTLHLFADDYGRDPLLTYLVDTRDIWIVPVVNPDGWSRVEMGLEWQRKNADPIVACGANSGKIEGTQTGVDLNRNHPYQWNAGNGASTDPCAETYQGPKPESEPETQAIRDLIDQVRPTALITWHAYGNQVLWPWGYKLDTRGAAPVLDVLGGKLAALTGYRGGPAGTTLYLTTGELTDWAWATRQTAGFTIEVGSGTDGLSGNPFAPPYANMDRYWRENRAAALYLARVGDAVARASAPDPAPPTVTAPPGALAATVGVSLTAGSGGAPTAVELFLDSPGAEGTGTPGALAFDGRSATWSLAAPTYTPGRHAVFVRARDASGRWGPLNAASALFGRPLLFLPSAVQRNAAGF